MALREQVLEAEVMTLKARVRELEKRLARTSMTCPLCGIKVTK